MNRQLLTLLLLSALAYSCASPIPISKLSANDNEGKWIAGRKFITKELNGHYITLSYYRNDGDMLIFDVLYDNRSSDTLIFDPSNALISAYAPDMFHLSTQKAVDPELKILEYDRSAAREEARLVNDRISELFINATDLATTIVESTDPRISQEEADARFIQRNQMSDSRQLALDRREAFLQEIKNTRVYWEETPVRKTTVLTNEYISGLLFFERNRDAQFYTVSFTIPKHGTIDFEFEQALIKP
ncbi:MULTISPECIES: hypothetical protein [Roseivirga]|nr:MULTISPECIES: hypothetical protein [Roseivirga]